MKYFLSIISVFKNESTILEEWIKHYIKEGVEHFYLVNHNSDDNFMQIIDKYKNYITLKTDDYKQEEHILDYLMNKHYLDLIKKESEWVIVCDIDEYIYNRHNYRNIVNFLKNNGQVKDNIGTIWIPWQLFYATKNKKIINSIIDECVEKKIKTIGDFGDGKSIYRTRDLVQLFIHHGSTPYNYFLNCENKKNKKDTNKNDTLILNNESNLYCNHYRFISEEYYYNIKCVRLGQAKRQNYIYTMEHFNNINSEENRLIDLKLKNKIYNLNNFVQTYFDLNNVIVQESKISYKNFNNFNYNFYNDEACIDFISKNFESNVLNAYNKIKPKAFKADLFRYCYLYIYGGIYADIDTICLKNLDSLLDIKYDIVLVNERSNIPGFFQAFIISKPNQKLFLNAINKIVKNVNNNYYGTNKYHSEHINNILSVTGPVLLANTLCNMLNLPEFSINNFNREYKLNNCYIKLLKFTDDGYINDYDDINLIKVKNNKYVQNDDYKSLFRSKNIYN